MQLCYADVSPDDSYGIFCSKLFSPLKPIMCDLQINEIF